MANKITGKVILLTDTKSLTSSSGNTYSKRDFVIERIVFDRNTGQPTADPTDTPVFSLIGDSCAWLDNAKIGDEVTVDYELRGRSYQKDGATKYFNDIRVFHIEVKGQSTSDSSQSESPWINPSPQPASPQPASPQPAPMQFPAADDDLPF